RFRPRACEGECVMKHPLDDLSAYLDGALPALERQALEAHLGGCPDCRRERDRLAGALAVLAAAPAPPPPSPSFAASFQRRLESERPGFAERLAMFFAVPKVRLSFAGGAVAAALVAAVAMKGMQGRL